MERVIASTIKTRRDPAPDAHTVRSALHVSRERMARMLDVSARTVERWERARTLPSRPALRQRIVVLHEIAELGHQVYSPQGFQHFLTTPLPVFGGRTAVQLIASGEAEQVLAALAADYEGLGF